MVNEPEIERFYWDYKPKGNVEHMAENGVTPDDVEEVHALGPHYLPNTQNRRGLLMLGQNSRRRYLLAPIYQTVEPGEWVAATAYWIERGRAERYLERGNQ